MIYVPIWFPPDIQYLKRSLFVAIVISKIWQSETKREKEQMMLGWLLSRKAVRWVLLAVRLLGPVGQFVPKTASLFSLEKQYHVGLHSGSWLRW